MAHNESQLSADVAEQSLVDDDEQSSTEDDELLPEDSEADIALVEQRNKRFLQAVSYLIEWAKHIITLGSALMVLGIALLKDLVRNARPPFSYLIAGLLVLSYLSMLGAIWLALRLVRYSASTVLTMAPHIVTSNKLASLQAHLNRVQMVFLIGLMFFSFLALSALLSWAFG